MGAQPAWGESPRTFQAGNPPERPGRRPGAAPPGSLKILFFIKMKKNDSLIKRSKEYFEKCFFTFKTRALTLH